MKKTLACIIMGLMVMFLAGVALDNAVPKASAAEPKRGGRFTFAFGWDPGHWDPHLTQSYKTQYYLSPVHAKLTRDKQGEDVGIYDFIIAPDIATKWEFKSPTELVYTLRKGVKWQNRPPVNGRELTSADVKYTFDRMVEVKSPNRGYFLVIKSIETPDPYTVKFIFSEPFAPILKYFSLTYAFILPKEVVEQFGDLKKWESAIGAGPFMLKEYKPNEYAHYVRNPDYYEKGRPYLDEVWCPIISQEEVRKAAFRTRQIDYADQWEYSEAIAFQKEHPEVKIEEFYSNSYARLVFACDRPPFNDKRVRQAASMCMDRKKAIDAIYEGHGVLENHVARAVWGSLPHDNLGKAKKYLYPDVEEARKLVKAAGYELPLKISLVFTSAYVATYRAAAEAYIGMLNSSGVFQVTPVVKEYGAYIRSNFRGNYEEDCFYALTTPPIDADAFLWDMYHSTGAKNGARVKDPYMDRLIEAQRRELNEEKRLKILHEIQLYMAEQMFTAPVQASALQNVLWGDVIKGYKMHLVPSYNLGDRFRITWRAK